MKKWILIVLFTISQVVLLAQASPTIAWKQTTQKFGIVRQGDPVQLFYLFTNTGNAPLLISDAKFECTCTEVEFPRYIIKPGETDTVFILFDTKGKYDRQDRKVDIISNATNSPSTLRFKGVVLKSKK